VKRILCVLACVFIGCERSATKTAPAANVQIVHCERGEIVRSVALPGNVRAYQEATLYAKVAGYLKTIAVDKGDAVNEGDLLAELEAPEMLADLARYKAEAEVTEIDYKRVGDAAKKAPDLVMPQTVDEVKGKYDMAKANLKRINDLLAYARITAPFSGIVTKRWVDPGAFIPAATSSSAAKTAAIVTLMDFRRVRIDVWVPETEVPLVKNDLPVAVTVEEIPGRVFDGQITRFAYALDDATKTMATEIEIPNPDLALRPGMYASVKIALQKKIDVLLVPAEALVTENKKSFVYTVADGQAKKVSVKCGFDDGLKVEILEGLAPHEPVILAGKQAVADGQPVNAMETSWAGNPATSQITAERK
jgi:membrane fusion protein (multidrug efflux system)